jgi:hypothetical protein
VKRAWGCAGKRRTATAAGTGSRSGKWAAARWSDKAHITEGTGIEEPTRPWLTHFSVSNRSPGGSGGGAGFTPRATEPAGRDMEFGNE